MKKLYGLFFAFILFSTNAFAVADWDKTSPATASNAADIGVNVAQNNNEALDRLLIDYRRDCTCVPSSSTSFNVLTGEVAIPNSDSSVVRWRKNTSITAVTASNIDIGGSFSNSTSYYAYAVGDATATTFTIKLSTSSSAPSGTTYYRPIGYLYIDGSGNIANVGNIKGGDVSNMEQTVSTVSDTLSDTSYGSGITGTQTYFSTIGRPIKIDAMVNVNCGTGTQNNFILNIDGSDISASETTSDTPSNQKYNLYLTCTAFLSPGVHYAQIRGKVVSNSLTATKKVIQVSEL